jgi:ribosomal protein S18 acetylase RimI-like enzyme
MPVLALLPPNPAVRLRPVTLNDLDALLLCCWTDRSRDVARWLLTRVIRNQGTGRGAGVVLLAPQGERMIGYGQITLWPQCAEISDLFVAEPYRSQGYGTAIIQYLMQQAIHLQASCVEIGAAEHNPRALALYQRLGFVAHRTLLMNLGTDEREPVIYLRMTLPKASHH